ncbi:MAG: DUF4861 domain-containing protein [Prevotella sp.]|nr:DUF4861 domain-containing protein [Prevotella sp.]
MKLFLLTATLMMGTSALAQQTVNVKVTNNASFSRQSVPVVIALDKYGPVASALVKGDGTEIPCQLDDLDSDGQFDELCFITDLERKQTRDFTISLSQEGKPREYKPQVYVEMMLANKKIKETNKQDIYISSLTVDRDVNPYNQLHHHGPAFENDMVAYRVYFDHRQTIDIYGKYRRGLEIMQTQFYPDETQKALGYGDDVLWVGETLGLGTLRGFDGSRPTMVKDVEQRGQRIVSRGPLRTIVEMVDKQWKPSADAQPVDMTTRYTLYAGRRDLQVDVKFSRPVADLRFSTGIINVKNSTEYSDKKGIRGCWGTDWPVSEKDSAGHKRETVGLGICIPRASLVQELPADNDNYAYEIAIRGNQFHYAVSFCSDNENFGYHNADDWFNYLKLWKREREQPVVVKIF